MKVPRFLVLVLALALLVCLGRAAQAQEPDPSGAVPAHVGPGCTPNANQHCGDTSIDSSLEVHPFSGFVPMAIYRAQNRDDCFRLIWNANDAASFGMAFDYMASGCSGDFATGDEASRKRLIQSNAAGDELYLMQDGGNVGIGTTNPGEKLTVAGVIRSTDGGIRFPDGTVQTTSATGVWSDNCLAIQAGIDALPPTGGQVIVHAGTYTCTVPIVIDRDNVDLRGQGPATVLRLADSANSPVLVLGQTTTLPFVTRSNIRVSDLFIDGNRESQTLECWGGPCDTGGLTAIRNNGITLRRVSDVLIERVTVSRARSGGLVSEKGSRRLTVRDFTSFDNHFDGLAAYETEDSTFSLR